MKAVSSYLDPHFREDFIIYEENVKLNPKERRYIGSKLELLLSRSPANATLVLKFKEKANKVVGELSIVDVNKIFKCMSEGSDPWRVYQQLERKMDKELLRWKQHRFMNIPDHYRLSSEYGLSPPKWRVPS